MVIACILRWRQQTCSTLYAMYLIEVKGKWNNNNMNTRTTTATATTPPPTSTTHEIPSVNLATPCHIVRYTWISCFMYSSAAQNPKNTDHLHQHTSRNNMQNHTSCIISEWNHETTNFKYSCKVLAGQTLREIQSYIQAKDFFFLTQKLMDNEYYSRNSNKNIHSKGICIFLLKNSCTPNIRAEIII